VEDRPAYQAAGRVLLAHDGNFTVRGRSCRPYATATGMVADPSGHVIYDLFYPSDYGALGFKSPIVTWGHGTLGTPAQVPTLLSHFASYGFTLVANTNWPGSAVK
jgi:hypothetical protein